MESCSSFLHDQHEVHRDGIEGTPITSREELLELVEEARIADAIYESNLEK